MAMNVTFGGDQTNVVGKPKPAVERMIEAMVSDKGIMGKCADGREVRQADSMIPGRFKRGETPLQNLNLDEGLGEDSVILSSTPVPVGGKE